MKSFSYHSYNDTVQDSFNTCSVRRDDLPLVVNCAGFVNLSYPFNTVNERGRLDYYLMYIAEGELSVEINGERRCVGAGDFLIFPPERAYRYSFSGEGNITYYFVHFTGSFAEKLLSLIGFSPLAYVSGIKRKCAVAELFSELFSLCSADCREREIKCGAQLQLILAALSDAQREGIPSALSRSLSYVGAYYTEDIRVGTLAKMESLSVSRYNTLFKRVTGTSPIQYITSLRIKHACSLLETTDMDVGRIGDAVGYSDKHFFSKIFKKHVGTSAKEYREKRK